MTLYYWVTCLFSEQRFCATDKYNDEPNMMVNQHLSFENVMKSVSSLKQQVQDLCKQEVIELSKEGLRIIFCWIVGISK